jgi:hypothetical protein
MSRSLVILVLGVALGLLGGAGTYWAMTAGHRAILRQDQPELAWLQQEFKLSSADYARIAALHQAYLPKCAELCARVARTEARIRNLLDEHDRLTPEIEELLLEAAQIRVECQKSMLEHFFAVSRAMPPEQGRRYLVWVREKTFLMDHEKGGARETSHGHHRDH